MCTLARYHSVIPGVAFPSARAPIREASGFARLDFRLEIPCCLGSRQAGFWSYPLHRISVPVEPTIRYSRYLFNCVAPHPSCPLAGVLSLEEKVRIVVLKGWCFIIDSACPGRHASTSTIYAAQSKPQYSSKLQQSSTGSSRPTGCLWPVHQKSRFTEPLLGTAGISLNHSCKPPIKRQGITLP